MFLDTSIKVTTQILRDKGYFDNCDNADDALNKDWTCNERRRGEIETAKDKQR